MSMYSLLRATTQAPSEEDIEECLAGNLWCVLAGMEGEGGLRMPAHRSMVCRGRPPGSSRCRPWHPHYTAGALQYMLPAPASHGCPPPPLLTPPPSPCSRCTGYRPILDAFKVFAKADPAAYSEEAIAANKGAGAANRANGAATNGAGAKLCPSSGMPCACGAANGGGAGATNGDAKPAGCGAEGCCGGKGGCAKAAGAAPVARPSCEPIFPPKLKSRSAAPLLLSGPLASWVRPTSLGQLLELKAAVPSAKLVGGVCAAGHGAGGAVPLGQEGLC